MTTAFQKQFRQEMIDGFEVNQSLLRDCVTHEAVIKGNEAEFLVSDSGGATAVTRGTNGMIPAREDNNTQYTATLVEWHDLARKTSFNVFASQGRQRKLMQRTTMSVINRKIDSDIITELSNATVNTGAAATASETLCIRAKTILQVNEIPWDNNVYGLITPAFDGYLMQIDSYASADYVDQKPMTSGGNAWSDKPKMRHWLGVNWIVHPNLDGVGTNAEVCYMFHKHAIGHAANSAGLDTAVGYNEEQDYSYARCSVFMGSKILQNTGIVKINHDGSAFAAA